MKKLWQKNAVRLNPVIEVFETKGDLILDQKLVKYDVWGSVAQAKMLNKIGIITPNELSSVIAGLQDILKLNEQNKFILEAGDEDVHTKIENLLTEKCGEVGKKIHTGRSRNDQVLTVIRLFSKEQLILIWQELITLENSFLKFAKKFQSVAMPGYTHLQKAMPSTVGLWALAFLESLLDDSKSISHAYELNNQSPLGSAAGFGVPLGLDRAYSAKLLGFAKVQINPVYCQNSRGKIEAEIVASLIQILATINKFASDVLLFTTAEFNYFTISESLCSGSSIMPQKKNVDVAELLKSKVHLVLGYYIQLISLSNNLFSGYNRDLQDSKKPLMESFEIVLDSLKVADILINNLTPNKEKLLSSLTPEIFATHRAFELVKKDIPFREAYQMVGSSNQDIRIKDIDKLLKLSTHIGGTGNLGLKLFEKEVSLSKVGFAEEENNFYLSIKKLLEN